MYGSAPPGVWTGIKSYTVSLWRDSNPPVLAENLLFWLNILLVFETLSFLCLTSLLSMLLCRFYVVSQPFLRFWHPTMSVRQYFRWLWSQNAGNGILEATLGTRDFFSRVMRSFVVRRPTPLLLKAKDTSSKATRKNLCHRAPWFTMLDGPWPCL